ncbi:CheR family methyltransferase [Magnetofaba australis]|uniref:CheR family methyltransferase n=1 Tax=Magnetofaba australis TaxID=1472297 RepID=UPI001301DDDE|nr:protein-glutamate O-methyltransferase CheR [Magnetofaba australis]
MTGINLPESKGYQLQCAVAALVDSLEQRTPEELLTLLEQRNGQAQARFISSLTNNETRWLRDDSFYAALRTHVIPGLIQKVKRTGKARIFSAACSTGQEPYSVAMLLREHVRQRPLDRVYVDQIELIAGDIDADALSQARLGRYMGLQATRGLPEALRDRYFHLLDDEIQLHDEIRHMVAFVPINLAEGVLPSGQFDLILCRNVLIYFSLNGAQESTAHLAAKLTPDGLLGFGALESCRPHGDSVKLLEIGGYPFFRKRHL